LPSETVTVRHPEGRVHGFLHLRSLDGDLLADGDLIQHAHRSFHLLSYHLVQEGPSFPHPVDVSIDTSSRQVAVRYTDKDSKENARNETFDLPADLANGMVVTLLKNVPPARRAPSYPCVAGLVAPLAGKQPAFEGGPVWRIELVGPRLRGRPIAVHRELLAAEATEHSPVKEHDRTTKGPKPIKHMPQSALSHPFGHLWLVEKSSSSVREFLPQFCYGSLPALGLCCRLFVNSILGGEL
jgi:hypothetical protein